MTDVFISYKREERDTAAKIAAALVGAGYDVWWDAVILPGEEYRKLTTSILREAKAAIVMWSPLSVVSSWVQDEAELARKRGVLVPVLIEAVDDFPLGFGQLQTHTLIGWDGTAQHALFTPVLAAVEKLAGAPKAAAPPGKRKPRKGEANNDAEVAFWRGIHDSKNRTDFEAYLARYPQGMFADLARQRVAAAPALAAPGLQMPKLNLFADPGLRAPFGLHELIFILAVAIIAPLFLWPLVNVGLGLRQLFWDSDFTGLFDIGNLHSIIWMAPILVALAWLNQRLEAWLRVHQPSWGVAALRAGIGALLGLTFMIRIGRSDDGGVLAHLALWAGCVWAASLFANRIGPRLAAAFKSS